MGKSVKAILIGLTLTLGACGSGGGSNVNKFVGVWSPSSGTYTITCAGMAASTSQVTDTLTWTTGTSSDLVQTIPGTSCVLHADVTSLTATAASGQTCQVSSGGVTHRLTIMAYTFALGADGLTGSENYSGTDAATVDATGQTLNCNFTQQASYAKQ
jgi:hypothetical protein